MYYKQHISDLEVNYINNEFEYSTEFLCGDRVQLSNRTNQINSVGNCGDNETYINLNWDKIDFNEFETFFKKLFFELKEIKIKLSAYLKMHNELIFVDNKKDNREYGFIKIILSTENLEYSQEFSFVGYFSDHLKNKVLEYIKYIKRIVKLSTQPSKKMSRNNYPIIFSPQVSGCFIHEIIGHMLEDDFFDFYKNIFDNFQVPKELTIYDDIKGFESYVGLNKIDDDGTKIKPLKIISNGKINNIMATNKNKSFDKKLYGFSRREDFNSSSLPRMRCTSVKAGKDGDLNSIIKKSSHAIFLAQVSRAYVTPALGSYTLVGNGFEIENGTIVNFISNLTVRGNVVDDLKNIKYIGDDCQLFVSYCNKLYQLARVGTYAPTLGLSEVFFIEGYVHEKN